MSDASPASPDAELGDGEGEDEFEALFEEEEEDEGEEEAEAKAEASESDDEDITLAELQSMAANVLRPQKIKAEDCKRSRVLAWHDLPASVQQQVERALEKADAGKYAADTSTLMLPQPWPVPPASSDSQSGVVLVVFAGKLIELDRPTSRSVATERQEIIYGESCASVGDVRFRVVTTMMLHSTTAEARAAFLDAVDGFQIPFHQWLAVLDSPSFENLVLERVHNLRDIKLATAEERQIWLTPTGTKSRGTQFLMSIMTDFTPENVEALKVKMLADVLKEQATRKKREERNAKREEQEATAAAKAAERKAKQEKAEAERKSRLAQKQAKASEEKIKQARAEARASQKQQRVAEAAAKAKEAQEAAAKAAEAAEAAAEAAAAKQQQQEAAKQPQAQEQKAEGTAEVEKRIQEAVQAAREQMKAELKESGRLLTSPKSKGTSDGNTGEITVGSLCRIQVASNGQIRFVTIVKIKEKKGVTKYYYDDGERLVGVEYGNLSVRRATL